MTNGTPGKLAFELHAEQLGGLEVVAHVDRPDIVGDRPRELDRLHHGTGERRHRDDDPLVAGGWPEDELAPHRQLLAGVPVLRFDEQHHSPPGPG